MATIAGQTFTATVSPVSCTYTFSANAPDQNGNTWVVSADGSQRGVTVTVTPNDGSCPAWKATTNAPWITLTPTSGATSATVRVDYSANTDASARSGMVTFTRPDCNGDTCTTAVGLNQSGRPPNYTLRLTLMNGEELGGPFDGIVTGPNGFSCTLSSTGKTGACPPATFPAGMTVPLVVTLTRFIPDDGAIWRETGCDSITASPTTRSVETCFVNMNSNRDITLAIGCAICSPDSALDWFVEPQRQLPEAIDHRETDPDGTGTAHVTGSTSDVPRR